MSIHHEQSFWLNHKLHRIILPILVVITVPTLVASLLLHRVYAATTTWDGGGADNNWTTAANWSDDTAPVTGDTLVFDSAGCTTRPTPTNDFANGTSFTSIIITGDGCTLSGNSVSLTAGLVANTYTSGTSTVSLIIGGAGSVTKSEAGTLILSGVNTFTGGLNILSGTVEATTSDKALGGATGTGTVTIGDTSGSADATLLIGTTALIFANPIVLAGGNTGVLTIGNTGTAISTVFSGGVTGTNNLTINENATTGTITFATTSINNIGTITNIGAGTGTTTISGGVGTNVTAAANSSGSSGLVITPTVVAKTIGGTLSDVGNGITMDNNGNVFIVGSFNGTVDFDPSAGTDNKTSAGLTDVFLTKINADDSYGYTKTFGGTGSDGAYAVNTDTAGNVFLTGYFSGTVDFDPSAGTDNKTSAGLTDVFLTKINADDSYGYTKTFGGTGSDVGYGTSTDTGSNVFLTGNFNGTADFDPSAGTDNKTSAGSTDIFLTKINIDGSYSYTDTFGGTGSDLGRAVSTDTDGNVFLTGYFNETVDFDPSAGTDNKTSAGLTDVFLTKINADDSYGYTKTFGGTGTDVGYGASTDTGGNVFLTGLFNGTADFDPSAGVDSKTSAGGNDVFLTKINADGSYGYTKTFGGTGSDAGYGASTDTGGNVFLTGNFNGTADFDPSAGVDSKTSAGSTDIFLTKINADGSYSYTDTFGGTGTDGGTAVNTDTGGNVFLTGAFNVTADFDPSAGVDNKTSAGSNDIFFIEIIPVPPNATQSTLAPTSTDILANGTTTQNLTVTAKDMLGNHMGVGGATVVISKSSGIGSISPVTDNGDGTYTATVTSPLTHGSGVFTATVNGENVKGDTNDQTQATVNYLRTNVEDANMPQDVLSTSVSIANDAACVETAETSLHLIAANATSVRVSNDPLVAGDDSNYIPFVVDENISVTPGASGSFIRTMTLPWTLSSGNGQKTVYAQFRNTSNVESIEITDTISLASTCTDVPSPVEPSVPPTTPSTTPPATSSTFPEGTGLIAGDFARNADSSTVYYITESGQRRPFMNAMIFFSYTPNFSTVKFANDESVEAFVLGNYMPPKPGTVLVKTPSSDKVYAFADSATINNPLIRWVPTEVLAKQFYGSNWADYVVDLNSLSFSLLPIGSQLTDTDIVDTSRLLHRIDLVKRTDDFLKYATVHLKNLVRWSTLGL